MGRTLFQYDPVIGYRFVPHLKARVRHEGGGYIVRSNAAGFRSDAPFTPAPAPGVQRILVFGDSNTAGDGVSNGKRFSDLIQAALPGVEVLNFGLPSSGTDQQYLAFREVAAEMRYDLLLLCPMVDNIRRNLQAARLIRSGMKGEMAMLPKPYFIEKDGDLALCNVPVPKGHQPVPEDEAQAPVSPLRSFARQVMAQADARMPGLRSWSQRARRLALPAEFNSPDHPGWRLMRAILAQWISEARAPVLLAPIPTFDHIAGNMRTEPYRARFAELARDMDVPWADILPDLHAIPPEDRRDLRFEVDEHFTAAGHEKLAQLLIPHVVQALEAQEAPLPQMSAQ